MTKGEIKEKIKDFSFDLWGDIYDYIKGEVDLTNKDLEELKKISDEVLDKISEADEYAMECFDNYVDLLFLEKKRELRDEFKMGLLKKTGDTTVKILWQIVKMKIGV